MEQIIIGRHCMENIQPITVNPLFNLYDKNGVYIGDPDVYPQSSFRGCKLFGYAIDLSSGETNTTLSLTNDTELGFPLVYKQFKSSSEIVFQNFQKTDNINYIPTGSKTTKACVGYNFYNAKSNTEYHAY